MRRILPAVFLLPGLASAAEVDGAANLKVVADVILYACPLVGLFLIAMGVYQFYTYSKTGNLQYSIGNSFAKIFAGVLLTSSQWLYALLASSFMTNPQVDFYGRGTLAVDQMALQAVAATGLPASSPGIPTSTITTLFAFIFVFGLIAFVNGVFKLQALGDGKGDDKDRNMAVFRIAGGMACMNITSLSCTLSSFLGLSLMCSS